VQTVVPFILGMDPYKLRGTNLLGRDDLQLLTAAAPSPVCEAIVNPVSRDVIAAARTSLRSISSSGPRLTPILMNRGR
jgi:hypothetical protein